MIVTVIVLVNMAVLRYFILDGGIWECAATGKVGVVVRIR
jgi:hypothetical protein